MAAARAYLFHHFLLLELGDEKDFIVLVPGGGGCTVITSTNVLHIKGNMMDRYRRGYQKTLR